MKIKKNDLLDALNLVKPGLSKKDIIEQAAHFIFSDNELSTFNDSICIMQPFELDNMNFSVRGDDLFKIISGISCEDIDITLEEETLNIKAKQTKAKLSTMVDEASQIAPVINKLKQMVSEATWLKLPEEFLIGISLCSFSASNDLSSGVKACCAVKGDCIYTTDNVRVSTYVMDKEMETVLLPVKNMLELLKYKVTHYFLSENWAHFKTDNGTIFNSKIMKGDYPFKAIEKLVNIDPEMIVLPDTLSSVIASISPLADGENETNKYIDIQFKSKELVCTAEKERGSIVKTVDCAYEGPEFAIKINPTFFCQILTKTTSFAILEGKGVFISDNFIHLMVLPREN